MKINIKLWLFLVSTMLLVFTVSCSSNAPIGAEIKSFKVTPLTISPGETVTATWEITGTGPFTVLLNGKDVSDKTSETFTLTRTTNFNIIVEDPWITTERLWRKVEVEE